MPKTGFAHYLIPALKQLDMAVNTVYIWLSINRWIEKQEKLTGRTEE
ncbi:hypothetical protein HQ531_04655 [bacterium]|nr:hypothetical protein [bacterium]